MGNPAPRPALRKAPDADTHPALGETPTEVDLRTSGRPALKRPPIEAAVDITVPKPTVEVAPTKESKKSKKVDKRVDKKVDKKVSKKDRKKLKAKAKRLKLHNKLVKKVRAKARSGAKARGTAADSAVGSVLADLKSQNKNLTWFEGR